MTLVRQHNGETVTIGEPQTFEVERLTEGALPGSPDDEVVAFWERLASLQRSVSAANAAITQTEFRLERLQSALYRSRTAPGELDDQFEALRQELFEIEEALGGNQSSGGIYDFEPSTVGSRIGFAALGTSNSTYGPSPAHEQQLGFAEDEFAGIRERLNTLTEETIPAFEDALADAGAPWTPNRVLPPM